MKRYELSDYFLSLTTGEQIALLTNTGFKNGFWRIFWVDGWLWWGCGSLTYPKCATSIPFPYTKKISPIYPFLRVCYTYLSLQPNQISSDYLIQNVQKSFLFFPMYLYMKIETTSKNSFVYFIVRKTIYTIKFQKMFRDNFFLFLIIYT